MTSNASPNPVPNASHGPLEEMGQDNDLSLSKEDTAEGTKEQIDSTSYTTRPISTASLRLSIVANAVSSTVAKPSNSGMNVVTETYRTVPNPKNFGQQVEREISTASSVFSVNDEYSASDNDCSGIGRYDCANGGDTNTFFLSDVSETTDDDGTGTIMSTSLLSYQRSSLQEQEQLGRPKKHRVEARHQFPINHRFQRENEYSTSNYGNVGHDGYYRNQYTTGSQDGPQPRTQQSNNRNAITTYTNRFNQFPYHNNDPAAFSPGNTSLSSWDSPALRGTSHRLHSKTSISTLGNNNNVVVQFPGFVPPTTVSRLPGQISQPDSYRSSNSNPTVSGISIALRDQQESNNQMQHDPVSLEQPLNQDARIFRQIHQEAGEASSSDPSPPALVPATDWNRSSHSALTDPSLTTTDHSTSFVPGGSNTISSSNPNLYQTWHSSADEDSVHDTEVDADVEEGEKEPRHLVGLDNYEDYDDGQKCGATGSAMMSQFHVDDQVIEDDVNQKVTTALDTTNGRRLPNSKTKTNVKDVDHRLSGSDLPIAQSSSAGKSKKLTVAKQETRSSNLQESQYSTEYDTIRQFADSGAASSRPTTAQQHSGNAAVMAIASMALPKSYGRTAKSNPIQQQQLQQSNRNQDSIQPASTMETASVASTYGMNNYYNMGLNPTLQQPGDELSQFWSNNLSIPKTKSPIPPPPLTHQFYQPPIYAQMHPPFFQAPNTMLQGAPPQLQHNYPSNTTEQHYTNRNQHRTNHQNRHQQHAQATETSHNSVSNIKSQNQQDPNQQKSTNSPEPDEYRAWLKKVSALESSVSSLGNSTSKKHLLNPNCEDAVVGRNDGKIFGEQRRTGLTRMVKHDDLSPRNKGIGSNSIEDSGSENDDTNENPSDFETSDESSEEASDRLSVLNRRRVSPKQDAKKGIDGAKIRRNDSLNSKIKRENIFANLHKQSAAKVMSRESFAPNILSVNSEKKYPTYVCPNCKTEQRTFFSADDTGGAVQGGPGGYLAIYFALYVVLSLFIFGIEEGWKPLDCIYFAVITLTTAGLGDLVPTTNANKIVCSIFIYFGVACIGLLLGSYIAGMLDERAAAASRERRIKACPTCAKLNTIKERCKQSMTENSAFSGFNSLIGRSDDFNSSRTQDPGASFSAQMLNRKEMMFQSERCGVSAKQNEIFARRSKCAVHEPKDHVHHRRVSNGTNRKHDTARKSSQARTSMNDDDSNFYLSPNESSHSGKGTVLLTKNDSPTTPKAGLTPVSELGSPVTRRILSSQGHTRHYSFDIKPDNGYGNDVPSGLKRSKDSSASFQRDYGHRIAPSPSTTLDMSGRVGDRRAVFAANDGKKSDGEYTSTDTSEDELLHDDDSGYSSDDSTGSSCSTTSTQYLTDEKKIKVQTAKFVFLTLQNALLNSLVIIACGCMGFWLIEGFSLVDSWYFTTVLLTTVGYGDITPSSPGGKLFATIYILVGGTILLNNMSSISMIPLELRRLRIERAVLTQFGDQLDDATLRELATGPVIQRLHLSANRADGLDECTREMFALAMLVRLGKVTEDDIRQTFASFRRLDVNNEGVLNSKSIIAGMIKKTREQQLQQQQVFKALRQPSTISDSIEPTSQLRKQQQQQQSSRVTKVADGPTLLTNVQAQSNSGRYWFGRQGSLYVDTDQGNLFHYAAAAAAATPTPIIGATSSAVSSITPLSGLESNTTTTNLPSSSTVASTNPSFPIGIQPTASFNNDNSNDIPTTSERTALLISNSTRTHIAQRRYNNTIFE